MIDLCEFLTVKPKDSAVGTVIEECSDFNGELNNFVLVLEPDKIPLLKDWIGRNVRSHSDHCIQMLDSDARGTFNFLKRLRSISSCTSEFVLDAGGIQGFIDKYSILKVCEPEPEPEPEPETEPEPEPQECSFTHASEPTSDPATVQVQPQVIPDPEPEIHSKTTIQQEIIHRSVTNVMDYDPNLIDSISDGQIASSLAKLKELNDQIALGGLDQRYVLSDADLEEVYKKIYTYPPEVFKSFILAYLKSVNSETERFRISAVMDDFLDFIKG